MDLRTFDKFRSLIYDRSGISLADNKETLVSARLGKRMRTLGISELNHYYQYVIDHEQEGELTHLLNAITTNVTSFFREIDHFEFLTQAVAEWLDAGRQRLRLWSAACSTGEEPYSMALILREALGDAPVDVKILATDISLDVLAQGVQGRYVADRLKPVNAMLKGRYFTKDKIAEETYFEVGPALKDLVVFKQLNLAAPPFPMQGPLDIVFCRNVMIYFDRHVRTCLLREIYRLLRPGGVLIVGHAESLAGIATSFATVKATIYTKTANGGN